MKILDLTVVSPRFASLEIEKTIGRASGNSRGRVRSFKKLTFTDDEGNGGRYSVSLESLDGGLGFYFRNFSANRLVLIPASEITRLIIDKEADVVSPAGISAFRAMKALGFSEEAACRFLMPMEMKADHPAFFTVMTEDTVLRLEVDKNRAHKLHESLRTAPYGHLLEYNIKPLKII